MQYAYKFNLPLRVTKNGYVAPILPLREDICNFLYVYKKCNMEKIYNTCL